jgi:hypothetical protein
MLRLVQVVSGSIANTMAEALCSQHGRVRHARLAQPMSALSLKRTFISQLLTTSGFHHKTAGEIPRSDPAMSWSCFTESVTMAPWQVRRNPSRKGPASTTRERRAA